MAVPATTARVAPTNFIALREGKTCKISFSLDPDISFYEIDVQPSPIDNGTPIQQSTQWNSFWHTKAPNSLSESGEGKSKVAYDPAVITQIIAIIGREGSITIHMPDTSTEDYFGYLSKFERDPMAIGTRPEATVTFVITDWDRTNKVEQGRVVNSVAGT